MRAALTFNPNIATSYHVDPCNLAIHGFGTMYEYVICFRDLETFLVADSGSFMETSHARLPFYCTKGCRIELDELPRLLQIKLGLCKPN